jgi:hypothetical protein
MKNVFYTCKKEFCNYVGNKSYCHVAHFQRQVAGVQGPDGSLF